MESLMPPEPGERVDCQEPYRQRYFGIYCPYHKVWLRRVTGDVMFYPAMEIAQAALDSEDSESKTTGMEHLWQATEFGKQRPININTVEPGSPICTASS